MCCGTCYRTGFFCCDSILLRQGPRGVPIGGFLSAQMMVLWAIFCESVLLDRDSMQKHMQAVNEGLSRRGLPHYTFTPGPQLTFPKDIALPRRRNFFACYGMRGWFDQQHKILGWVRLGNVSFALQVLGLWDSFPSRCFGHIIAAAPKRARPLLTAHFHTLNPRDVMLVETTFPKSCVPDSAPVTQAGPTVLLSRFMDNNCIGYVLFSSADAFQQVVQFTPVFLGTLYNIPMKWEPSGPVNDWCESPHIWLGTEPPQRLRKNMHLPNDGSNRRPSQSRFVWGLHSTESYNLWFCG